MALIRQKAEIHRQLLIIITLKIIERIPNYCHPLKIIKHLYSMNMNFQKTINSELVCDYSKTPSMSKIKKPHNLNSKLFPYILTQKIINNLMEKLLSVHLLRISKTIISSTSIQRESKTKLRLN